MPPIRNRALLFRRYLWLYEQISSLGPVTFEEIDRRWRRVSFGDGSPLSHKTFENHRRAVEDMFDVTVKCNRSDNSYYIDTDESESVRRIRRMYDNAILLREIASGRDFGRFVSVEPNADNTEMLRTVLEAIDESREIHLHYRHNYDPAREERTVVKPIGIKLFRQRWYLIAETTAGEAYSYALDRILNIAKGATIVPSSLTLDTLFADSYGIIRESQAPVEEIELRVENEQANYFLSLPLHPSQELARYEDGYAIFRLRVAPTYDFIMDILSHGDKVEVLAPQSLRDTIRAKLETVLNLYNR